MAVIKFKNKKGVLCYKKKVYTVIERSIMLKRYCVLKPEIKRKKPKKLMHKKKGVLCYKNAFNVKKRYYVLKSEISRNT